MSQQSVLDYLNKCKKPKTSKQIRKAVKLSSIGMSLRTLRKHGEVQFKRIRRGYVYWSKGIQDLKIQEIIK